MGRIGFVFSGQGDQYPGMGYDLYEKYPQAREIFDMCEELFPELKKLCFKGPEEELIKTINTQPCLFAMELSAFSVLINKGIIPDSLAGFSLGETVAATASGMFDIRDGFRLVCKRAEYMQREADRFDTSMMAVVRLSAEEVEQLCEGYKNIYPVNYNCPGQITVSGLSSEMEAFAVDVKNSGGRAIPLKVKGGFHTPFMNKAAADFKKEVMETDIRNRKYILYSDVTAVPYKNDVAELLSLQICMPVKWEQIIRNMINDGVDTFIEIGPGRTLTNMIKKTDETVKAVTVYDYLKEVEAG